MEFINKIFKAKAKNSDDESNVTSMNDHNKEDEGVSSRKSNNDQNVRTGVINRKKKRTLAFYDNKYRQQKKHPGSAKVIPAPDKPNENKVFDIEKKEDQPSDQLEPKPGETLPEGKNPILEEFDPLWTDMKMEKESENSDFVDTIKIPVKPPRNKNNNEKLLLAENKAVIKVPELKVAKMESIQENELVEEEIIKEIPKDGEGKQMFAQANVSYEGLEGVFSRPVINDRYETVNEGVFPSTSFPDIFPSVPNSDIFPSTSSSGIPPVFVQPRKNPWNAWPGICEDNSAIEANAAGMNKLGEALKKIKIENNVSGSNPVDQLEYLFYQASDEEEKKSYQMIAEFFAEEARPLDDQDIANYSRKIEISKIEIYEEDIKKYHQSLKYRRGPIDHDIIFTTVETALNFIEKLTKEREQKKKVSFLPELLEKCLKGKTTRQREEERKKREKEERQKKDRLKPKMWLVFNRISKEKVIICTPGDFYDSDSE